MTSKSSFPSRDSGLVDHSAGHRYLIGAIRILEEIMTEEWSSISDAADAVASTISSGGLVHVFGTGHSHMLAEEMFYRAGGLAAINPILVDSLMLHDGAENSTRLERLPGLAETIFPDVPVSSGDTLIVASNSGGNAVCAGLARLCAQAGAQVVAIISGRHAANRAGQRPDAQLEHVADVLIDNRGIVGDASVAIEGLDQRVAATSTVAGAAIMNAIVAEAVERLMAADGKVEVFTSSNVEDGDELNAELLARYRNMIKAL